MLMGKQDRVHLLAFASQHLLAKIRTAVNHERIAIAMNPNRHPKPLVFWVVAQANRVIAPNYGNAL